jgi:hypothetical protein
MNARESGIGVHLAINGKLHPWGKEVEANSTRGGTF